MSDSVEKSPVRAGPRRAGKRPRRVLLGLFASSTLLLAPAAPAGAANKAEELFSFGSLGTEAGQFQLPEYSAADPRTGQLFVGERNNRIDEFTPWGRFVRSIGWDVAPGAVNERQEVRVRADEGDFKLSFDSEATADLHFDATAEEVQDALEGLGAIDSVTVTERPGGAGGAVPFIFTIVFKGALAGTDVPQLQAEEGSPPLGGGTLHGEPATELQVRTLADGTLGSTGLEACTAESGCQAGLAGPGAGEIRSVDGLAVDVAGDLYAAENVGLLVEHSKRVQKFSPSGAFLWMAGGGVDKGPHHPGNLCTAQYIAEGDECGIGSEGPGNGQFSGATRIALAPGGATLYVAGGERIQELSAAGEYLGEVPDPEEVRKGKSIRRLAVNPQSGDLYIHFHASSFEDPPKKNVFELNPATGKLVRTLAVERPAAMAAGPEGHLYVVGEGFARRPEHVIEFDSAGNQLEPPRAKEEECEKEVTGYKAICESLGIQPPEATNISRPFSIAGLGAGPAGDLFAAIRASSENENYLRAYGPQPLEYESPEAEAPEILAQYATSVGNTAAALRAQVNPHLAPDLRYYVQYGTAACVETGGWEAECVTDKPTAPGTLLTDQFLDAALTTPSVLLEGLSPGTVYHYRFVAQSSGGGPVFGVGAGEAEGSFTTFRAPGPSESCPANEAFRTGPSALLPDCRAYEMVTPLDKGGVDIIPGNAGSAEHAGALEQASVSGGRFAYLTALPFGDAPSAPGKSPYIAARGGSGWTSHSLGHPLGRELFGGLANFAAEFVAFSPDLCEGWLVDVFEPEPPLDPAAPPGYQDAYRRSDGECGGPAYEALNGVTPPDEGPFGDFGVELQGISAAADQGRHAVFLANDRLAPGASATKAQLYEAAAGDPQPRLVCVLPGGAAWGGFCTAGSDPEEGLGGNILGVRSESLTGALSEDGSRVFWTAGAGAGQIYERLNPFGEGAECAEESSPCTVAVTSGAARFVAGSDTGARALYEEGGSLYEFNLEGGQGQSSKIAGEALGTMGASKDATRVYFASREALTPGQADALGEEAQQGRPNLYLYEAEEGGEGRYTFVAELSGEDLGGFPSPINPAPALRPVRVSPDGLHAAFMSFGQPTGYDNADASSGKPDAEVYLYDASANGGKGKLLCASCNPSGARPHGGLVQNLSPSEAPIPAAAHIPVPATGLYASRALSSNGRRLFFESLEALTPRDANGAADVYQWEAAGEGGCKEAGADYSPANEGCIDLISSGRSPSDSEFLDADPSGENVFFSTLSSLVPSDYGLVDIYDARIGGGLPSPPGEAAPCEGDACQVPPPAPGPIAPSSSAFRGPGDASEAPPKPPRCAKGKARRKGRCVAKRKGHAHRHKKHGRGR